MTLLATATCLAHAASGDLADMAPLPDQAPQNVAALPQTLYLDVSLNQAERGLAPFELVDGHLRGSVDTLRKLGFLLADRAASELVDLDRLPDVEVRYDAALQRLALQVPLAQLSLSTTVLKAEQVAPPSATASPGMLLNYDLYATRNAGASSVSLATEVRGFGIGRGMVDTTAVFLAYDRPQDQRWRSEAVRLDSAWQMDFPDSATSLTVGDFYSGFVDWSRSIRLGGIQIGRNYALQPYRVLTPTPSFLGEAVVPSTVELYVDGLRQYSGQVPAGPFQLAAQPGISGTGQAQIVVTDAFGQVRRLDFAFYGTPQLLARGISNGRPASAICARTTACARFPTSRARSPAPPCARACAMTSPSKRIPRPAAAWPMPVPAACGCSAQVAWSTPPMHIAGWMRCAAASTCWGMPGTTVASTSLSAPSAPTATIATWARCRALCRRASATARCSASTSIRSARWAPAICG